MSKKILVGPELFWLLMYFAAMLIARANVPPSKALEEFLEYLCYWIVVPVALTFALWLLPQAEKRWLLLRVWLAGIVGGHYVLQQALSAHSEQGPGIGTAYLVGMILIVVFLIVGTVIVTLIPAVRFRLRSPWRET